MAVDNDQAGANTSSSDNDMFHTAKGVMMKEGQKQIVTGMDKLVNPKGMTQADTIFDSSDSRDINEGSVNNEGGIQYKGLQK